MPPLDPPPPPPNPYAPPDAASARSPSFGPGLLGRIGGVGLFLFGSAVAFVPGMALYNWSDFVLSIRYAPYEMIIVTTFFSLMAFVFITPYRFLRSFFVPIHRLDPRFRFVTGFVLVAVLWSLNIVLGRIGIISSDPPTTSKDWSGLFAMVSVGVVTSVELECRYLAAARSKA